MIRALFLLIVFIGSLNPLVASSAPFVELDILVVIATQNMSEEELGYALEAVEALDHRIYQYSEGMATANVNVVYHEGDLWYSLSENGNLFPDDKTMTLLYGALDYDYAGVLASPSMIPIYEAENIRGMAHVKGADTFWVAALPSADRVVLHELAHNLESDKARAGYIKFPQCGENTNIGGGVHCAVEYGYENQSSEAWLDDYYSGDLPDGTGLTEEGWKTR